MDEKGMASTTRLPLIIAIMAVAITIVGGTIRIHDAGESCPDWPTCFGTWGFDVSPDQQELWWNENPEEIDSRGANHRYTTFEIFTEWLHRFLVGIIAIPIVVNLIVANKNRSKLGEKNRTLAISAAILLLIQAVAGYVTVRFDNADWTVALHLVLASSLIAVVMWQWLCWHRRLNPNSIFHSLSPAQAEVMRKPVLTMLLGSLLLLILGAWVSSTAGGNYNQACGVGTEAWPLCQGEIIPDTGEIPILVQMAHRIAVIIVGVILFLGYRNARANISESGRVLSKSISSSFHLWAMNVVVGGLYLFTASDGFIEWLSLLHLIVGISSFLALAFAAMQIDLAMNPEPLEDE